MNIRELIFQEVHNKQLLSVTDKQLLSVTEYPEGATLRFRGNLTVGY